MHIYDTKPDACSYTCNFTADIFYTSAQDTKRRTTTHGVMVKCHQVIQLTQLPLVIHSEVLYNSDTELLPPYHHLIIQNQGLRLRAHNGYIGEYSFLFLPESSGTHGHQHPPRTTLIVSNIALITTTHTYIYIYICSYIYIYIYIYTHTHTHTHTHIYIQYFQFSFFTLS